MSGGPRAGKLNTSTKPPQQFLESSPFGGHPAEGPQTIRPVISTVGAKAKVSKKLATVLDGASNEHLVALPCLHLAANGKCRHMCKAYKEAHHVHD